MKNFCLLVVFISFSANAVNLIPNSFSAQYENSWQSALGGIKKETGTLDFLQPNNVRVEVTSQPNSTLVTNKTTTWYYQPPFDPKEQGQVTLYKSQSHPVIKLLNSLKNGVQSSKYYTSKESGNDVTMTFNKEGMKEFNLKEVVLHGMKPFKNVAGLKDIDSIEMKDENGKSKTIRFIGLKEGVSFPASHFTFTVPANTKVIK